MERFAHDDEGYLGWLASHPHGFVVNTFIQQPSPDYLVLHRATCGTISGTPARGSRWTTGGYQKVCSEKRDDLDRWAHDTAGGALMPCSRCKP